MNAILELGKNSNVTVSETSVIASDVTKAVLDGIIVTPASLRIAELEKELMAARVEQEKEIEAEKARIIAVECERLKKIKKEKEQKEWELTYAALERAADAIKKLRSSSQIYRDVFNENRNFSVVFLVEKWQESHYGLPYNYQGALAEAFYFSKYNRGNRYGVGWVETTIYANISYLMNHNIYSAKCSPEFVDRLFEFLTDLN